MAKKGTTGFTGQQQVALYWARRRRLEVLRGSGTPPSGPPVNTVLPTVPANPAVGVVQSAYLGAWTGAQPITLTQQWQANSVNIAGATGVSYTPIVGDLGKTLRIIVSATNSAGGPITATSTQSSAITNPLAPPVNTLAPVLSGIPMVGNVLSITQGNWTGNPTPTYVYQFYMGATPVGSNTNSYVCAAGDVGKIPTCVVTASNSQGSVPATSNALSAVITNAPISTVAPALSSTSVFIGVQVTCSPGTFTGNPTPTLTQRWQSSTTSGGTYADLVPPQVTNAYSPVAGDLGRFLRCVTTATNSQGTIETPSNVSLAVISYAFTAPLLAWPGGDPTTDNTPDLTATFYESIIGHNIRLVGSQIAGAVAPYTVDQTNNIDSAEDAAMLAAFTTGALANGLTYMRCWIETAGGVVESSPSNVVSKTINAGPSAEVAQFLARTSGLNATYTNAFTALIDGLVADGVWPFLDILYIYVTNTLANAKVNLKSASFLQTDIGGGVQFTVNAGCAPGPGVLATGFIPSAGGHLYALNSATLGVFVSNSRTTDSNVAHIGGRAGNLAAVLSIGGALGNYGTVNEFESDYTNYPTTNAQGLSAVSRSSASLSTGYKNGVSVGTGAVASEGLPTVEMYVFGENNNGALGRQPPDTFTAAFVGALMNGTQHLSIYNRIVAYFTAVGA